MDHLEEIRVEELQWALDDVDEKIPALRLVAAIAYKHGITQSELADWFDVERKTIYNWLNRLDDRELATAVQNDSPPGRPRKLSNNQITKLKQTLRQPPEEAGYDSIGWTPILVRRYIRDRFGIDYSNPSCRRLMKEAGLRHVPSGASADQNDETAGTNSNGGRGGFWKPK